MAGLADKMGNLRGKNAKRAKQRFYSRATWLHAGATVE
jgi:hypothetical protein